ncbi:MAG TPA: hypothetical protein VJ755_03260 [Gemmatimonadales bacterium]|nr:hypothetical protein [Gemmatimonadales bacterium]
MSKRPDERPKFAEQRPQVQYDPMQGCLLRLFWTGVGNLALLALIYSISSQQGFTLLDGVYWLVVAALATARYLEITRFGGPTLAGTPATVQHFQHYARWLFLVALALWVGTHVLQRVL